MHKEDLSLVWFGLVLWNISFCRLFNTKFSSDHGTICIKLDLIESENTLRITIPAWLCNIKKPLLQSTNDINGLK